MIPCLLWRLKSKLFNCSRCGERRVTSFVHNQIVHVVSWMQHMLRTPLRLLLLLFLLPQLAPPFITTATLRSTYTTTKAVSHNIFLHPLWIICVCGVCIRLLCFVLVCGVCMLCVCVCVRANEKAIQQYEQNVLNPLPARPKKGQKWTAEQKADYDARSGPRNALLAEFKTAFGTAYITHTLSQHTNKSLTSYNGLLNEWFVDECSMARSKVPSEAHTHEDFTRSKNYLITCIHGASNAKADTNEWRSLDNKLNSCKHTNN